MSATIADVVAVRVPERTWRSEVRAVKIVWRRELIRFAGDRIRMFTSLIQPLLFLFVLGSGLQTLSAPSTGGVDLTTFIFPGVLCITVVFSAMFSAASIAWDREFGFLREMMVAPVRRSSIVIGKCFGGATIAALQGTIVLALAGLVGVPYDPVLLAGLFGLMLLLAFTITAFGVLIALRVKQIRLDASETARQTLDPGITWGSWHVPPGAEAAIVLLLGLVLLTVAIRQFNRTE
jgi:ABC-2 type transport system permease protein